MVPWKAVHPKEAMRLPLSVHWALPAMQPVLTMLMGCYTVVLLRHLMTHRSVLSLRAMLQAPAAMGPFLGPEVAMVINIRTMPAQEWRVAMTQTVILAPMPGRWAGRDK